MGRSTERSPEQPGDRATERQSDRATERSYSELPLAIMFVLVGIVFDVTFKFFFQSSNAVLLFGDHNASAVIARRKQIKKESSKIKQMCLEAKSKKSIFMQVFI